MANIGALSICSLLLSALALPNALAAEYALMPSPQTVHVGYFSAALKPPALFRRIIPIDRQARTATVAPGVVVPVPRPFFGVMGVAPLPAMGRISSAPCSLMLRIDQPFDWQGRKIKSRCIELL
jgi:hypothetical protein